MTAEAGEGCPVALVTGAGGGLGGELVRALSAGGWRVAAAGHRREPATVGEGIWACRLEVTDRQAASEVVSQVVRRWGRLDLLINNAGVVRDSVLSRMTDEDWDRVLDTNLKGAFVCARAVAPVMLERGEGQVLNIGSFAGRVGSKGQANYAAAKAGLIGLTLSLAREWGPHGVRCNVVLPGVLPTAMTADLPAESLGRLTADNVLGRMNRLSEVARLVVVLAGARDISGQVFQLDGRIGPWT